VIEAIPNISEGRRPEVVAALAAAVRATLGVWLLDIHSDPAHHRSVFTCAGEAVALQRAMIALVEGALATIDLRTHAGEHPRIGAVDVMPFVPLEGSTMAECVAMAADTAAAIAERFEIPVYLYEEAARQPQRRRLEDIRRGQFEGLTAKMALPAWRPDFGPAAPHPTFGALVIGARMPLIAYNINLATNDLAVARSIAAAVRERGGGLRCVKAMGVLLADRGVAQVSMNLTDFTVTPVRTVFDAVAREAASRGVDILESELVGLIPTAALTTVDATHIRLQDFGPSQVLERRLAEVQSAS
jgi:glutamate formiminotransferase